MVSLLGFCLDQEIADTISVSADDLRQHDDWYESIIMPAFERHRVADQRAVQFTARDVDSAASILARISVGGKSMQMEMFGR